MEKLLYNVFIRMYALGITTASLWNQKARLWHKGRRHIFQHIQKQLLHESAPVVWFHCASLGELEQAKPLMQSIQTTYSNYKIVLTFFSPSGYEVSRHIEEADYVFYLPIDTKKNAETFYKIIKPSLIIFVKYEFWYYYLSIAKEKHIPLLLISASFRKNHVFFKWYGGFYRNMLHCFTYLFVQDEVSFQLLTTSLHILNVQLAGDTRFDRVIQVAQQFKPIEAIEKFCESYSVVVAGSTWTEDDEELNHFVNRHSSLRFIIAPHDISKERLKECMHLYQNAILYSDYLKWLQQPNVLAPTLNTLIIDNIGMLKWLYAYATVCYVGGGFGDDGVHNVLEPAVYGKPVIFGMVYDKYIEAIELIKAGGGFSIQNALELEQLLNTLLYNSEPYSKAATAAKQYVQQKTGATRHIMHYIQENRLLTN